MKPYMISCTVRHALSGGESQSVYFRDTDDGAAGEFLVGSEYTGPRFHQGDLIHVGRDPTRFSYCGETWVFRKGKWELEEKRMAKRVNAAKLALCSQELIEAFDAYHDASPSHSLDTDPRFVSALQELRVLVRRG